MEQVLEYIAGPTGGMVVAALTMYGGYKLVVVHLLPLAQQWIERHFAHIDVLMEEHRQDRAVFEKAITNLAGRLDNIEEDVETIKERLNG